MGLFSAPNAAAIMNSVPARQRGAASGMLATFQNSGFVLSIGVFFSLMIAGLAATLPQDADQRADRQGVPHAIAAAGREPAAGRQPVRRVPRLQPGQAAARRRPGCWPSCPLATWPSSPARTFFPQLISEPFHHGLVIVFGTAMGLLVIAAGASLPARRPVRARGAGAARPPQAQRRTGGRGGRPRAERPPGRDDRLADAPGQGSEQPGCTRW